MNSTASIRDFLKLQSVVVSWSLTGILGALAAVSAIETAFLRTLISTLAFAGLLAWNRQSIAVSRRELGLLLLNGGLLGAYLILFFFAVEVSNASVAMAGLPTIVLWSAVLEPLMVRGRKLQSHELLLGLCSAAALWIMFAGGVSLSSGLLLSVLSALLTAIYMLLNARLVQRHASHVVSFYSMAGAALVSLLAMPLYAARLGNWSFLTWPTVNGWLAILTLSLVCTVLGYCLFNDISRRLSTFTINLNCNLDAVYGILLAGVLLNDWNELNSRFFIGTSILCGSVILHPLLMLVSERMPRTSTRAIPATA